jgi:hypothetical protein
LCLPLIALGPILAGILSSFAGGIGAGATAGGIASGAAAGAAAAGAAGASATLAVTGGVAASAAIGAAGAAAGTAAGAGLAGSIAGGIGGALGGLVSIQGLGLLASALGTGLSIKQSQDSGKAQAAQAEATQASQNEQLALEGEQQRQAAGTEIETSVIRGAKAVGEVRASGLSGNAIARLSREARAVTLRDISDTSTSFNFSRQGNALTSKAQSTSVRNVGRDIKASNLGGLHIANQLGSRGLRIAENQLGG